MRYDLQTLLPPAGAAAFESILNIEKNLKKEEEVKGDELCPHSSIYLFWFCFTDKNVADFFLGGGVRFLDCARKHEKNKIDNGAMCPLRSFIASNTC